MNLVMRYLQVQTIQNRIVDRPDQIADIQVNQEGLKIELSNGYVSELYPWIWMRDHAMESHSFSVETQQRTVDVFADVDISPASAILGEDNSFVQIEWDTGIVSRYSLQDLLGANPHRELWSFSPRLWSEVNFELSDLQVAYSETPTDSQLRELLLKIQHYGFCLVENCPADSQPTDRFLQNLGPYFNSHWGGFWEFENDLAQEDSAYGCEYIGPHNDCCYYDHAPYLQTFHCLMHNGTGGESLLVDGFAIAKDMRESEPESYQILTSVDVPYQCINTDISYWSQKPIIKTEDNGELQQICFNNADRGKVWYGYEKTKQFYDAYAKFYQLANDPQRQFRFKLTPGSLLIFNNWRLLHGRTAFTGLRKMCGSYHGIDSVVARYRSLA